MVSVVLCTWNRATLLGDALEALIRQDAAPPHEIIIVDNASTDGTRDVALRYAREHQHVRYLYETQPGLSHARNTGFRAAAGDLVVYTDDDVRVDPGWLRALVEASERYPDAACIGGPVLPEWSGSVPGWLTPAHWSPLGAQEYGGSAFRVDHSRPICLIGANIAFRRSLIEAIGPFDPSVQRVGNGIGSTEDHEYHLRIWRSGHYGIYDPTMRVRAVITPDRLSKRYHRAWHFGHGLHLARMRVPAMEGSRWRILGVPGHVLRQALADSCALIWALCRGDRVAAFRFEVKLWFAAGFARERVTATLRRRS